MRRRSGVNFEELINKEWAILTKSEYQDIQNLFKKTEQRNGGISFYDMINILKSNYLSNPAVGFVINQAKRDAINR